MKSELEAAKAEAVEIILRDIMKLAAGMYNGSAQTLVNALVRAAVAAVAESRPVPTTFAAPQSPVHSRPNLIASGWADSTIKIKSTDILTFDPAPQAEGNTLMPVDNSDLVG